MARHAASNGVVFSLSELAFVLFTLALLAAVLTGSRAAELRVANQALQDTAADLERSVEHLSAELEDSQAEIARLTADLDRLLGGVVACFRRPGATLPPLAATVRIEHQYRYVVTAAGAEDQTLRTFNKDTPSELRAELMRQLGSALTAAGRDGCYLRVSIVNRTESYQLYSMVEELVREMGMVAVNN